MFLIMPLLPIDENLDIVTLVGLAVTLAGVIGGGIGFLIKTFVDKRKADQEYILRQNQTRIDQQKLDLEKSNSEIVAAKGMADVLTGVIGPMSDRITALEKSNVELYAQVLELRGVIQSKDTEIASLEKKYNQQVEVSTSQARQIHEQQQRISELESEVRKFKEGKNG